ncbi:MAG TPA: DUF2599 domain-containing protein, partial [Pseudomonas sp.]|nr:DUF2599 domain-containing protein [Pseudomonas sp.]
GPMSRHTRLPLLTALLISTSAFAVSNAPAARESAKETQPVCATYVDSGAWVYRDYEWTLSLTPSECSRSIDSSQTAYMFFEIVKKFAGSPYWRNDRGMINQLTCHMLIAKDKDQWNLEPWRPFVGHTETVAQRCNVTTPAPDQPFH